MAPRRLIAPLLAGCLAAGCDSASVVGGPDATAPDAAADAATLKTPPDVPTLPYVPPTEVSLNRRLSNDEIRASWHDLLGSDETGTDTDLPPDPVVLGFDNNIDALVISAPYLERYATAVERRVAALQWARDIQPQLTPPCTPASPSDACMRSFVTTFGRRIFRRPLQPQEVEHFLAFAPLAHGDATAAARVMFAAMLHSPYFLYLVDGAVVGAATGARHRIDAYSLAARLSFLLWGSPPPVTLLDQAASGALDTDDGLRTVATTMLADARAHAGLQRFFRKWLRIDQTQYIVRGQGDYPLWRPEFAGYFAEETTRFVDALVWQDGASFLDLVSAQWTFVNADLATLYGFPAGTVTGAGWARVTFDPASDRSGVLTQASTLTISARAQTPSATRRGEFVRSALLCQAIPAPPPSAALVSIPMNVDARGRSAIYAANPICATCHSFMDPVGFGLERFNSVGAWGPSFSPTSEFSGRGRLEGFDPPDFTGAIELGARLRSDDRFAACVATQLFRFAFARPEDSTDEGTLTALLAGFRAGGFSFRELVLAVVLSEEFRTFQDAPGGTP